MSLLMLYASPSLAK